MVKHEKNITPVETDDSYDGVDYSIVWMPSVTILPAILVKSVLLALVAGLLITAGIAIMAVPFFWRATGEKQTEQEWKNEA